MIAFLKDKMARNHVFNDQVEHIRFLGQRVLISVLEPSPTLGIDFQYRFKMYNMNNLMWIFPNTQGSFTNAKYACVEVKSMAVGLDICIVIGKVFYRDTGQTRYATLMIDNEKGILSNEISSILRMLPLNNALYTGIDLSFILSPEGFEKKDTILCWVPLDYHRPVRYWRNSRGFPPSYLGVVDVNLPARFGQNKTAACNKHAIIGFQNDRELLIYKYVVNGDADGFVRLSKTMDVSDFDINENFVIYRRDLPNGHSQFRILPSDTLQAPQNSASSLDLVDHYKILDIEFTGLTYFDMILDMMSTNNSIALVVIDSEGRQKVLLYNDFQSPPYALDNLANRDFLLLDHHYIVLHADKWEIVVLDFKGSVIHKRIQERLRRGWRAEDMIHLLKHDL